MTKTTRARSNRTNLPTPLSIAWLALLCLTGRAQLTLSDTARQAGYFISSTGAHSRVWTRISTNGPGAYQTNQFRQLTTGLNRWAGNRWAEAKPQLSVVSNGIVGAGAQCAVVFSSNLNSRAAVQIKLPQTPDAQGGQWVRLNPLCLAYHDNSIGSNVYFAIVQDSQPILAASNRVVYPGAFDGAVASISYKYSRAGISQDVRFHARPPSPQSFGLNPATTHLLAITEVTDAPQPQLQERSWPSGLETLQDQSMTFGPASGPMRMAPGRAFLASAGNRNRGVPVAKSWLVDTNSGRRFIVERLQWSRIRKDLMGLPVTATNSVAAAATNAAIEGPTRWFASSAMPAAPTRKATLFSEFLTVDYTERETATETPKPRMNTNGYEFLTRVVLCLEKCFFIKVIHWSGGCITG